MSSKPVRIGLVSKDIFGLFVLDGYWIVRPIGETKFKEGDMVDTHHVGGTVFHGVGKTQNIRNVYDEIWIGSGSLKDCREMPSVLSRARSNRYYFGIYLKQLRCFVDDSFFKETNIRKLRYKLEKVEKYSNYSIGMRQGILRNINIPGTPRVESLGDGLVKVSF